MALAKNLISGLRAAFSSFEERVVLGMVHKSGVIATNMPWHVSQLRLPNL